MALLLSWLELQSSNLEVEGPNPSVAFISQIHFINDALVKE